MVEENRPDVIQMTIEGEEATACSKRPDFDLVVVTSGYEQRLGAMEVDTSDGAVVLLEPIYQGPHAVVP
jgi:hypothetical protein